MNVTPAAVSHRIKALEYELGQTLFIRAYRGVELTEAGAFLYLSLQRGFEVISDAVAQVRSRHDSTDVTISATTAMSGLWLTPRLTAFWRSYPGVTISQIVQDDGPTSGGQDLSIHYGDPDRESDETRILFRDRILAVGTPRFARVHGVSTAEDLLDVPLIHLQSGNRGWTDWAAWFRAQGLPLPRGPGFTLNNYLISLQAAQDDTGAVLGWEGLLGSHFDSGRLVPLVPEAMDSPWPFYLRIHARASAKARLFADWLVAEGGAFPGAE